MFLAELSTKVKNWGEKIPKYPIIYIFKETMVLKETMVQPVIKNDKIMKFAAIWRYLENEQLSEVSQRARDQHKMMYFHRKL